MMKRIFNFSIQIALTGLVLSFTSCSKEKVSIIYNARFADEHNIILDDSLRLAHPKNKSFTSMLILEGKHKIKIDGQNEFEFNAENSGDILNIANEEFVIYPLEFQLGKKELFSSFGLPNILVVDSFILVSELYIKFSGGRLSKKQALKAGNGNEYTELIKIPSSQLYISKTWDYDMMAESPTHIEERVSESTKSMTTYKRRILPAREFLNLALNFKVNYLALPLGSLKEE